ncbi:MAG TPA: hypothetical protein VI489_06030 [Candidatus Brocadiaceae bacterium]
MKLNENGNVELYDFQVRNHIDMMEHNIKMLKKYGEPVSGHIAGYFESDLNRFKKMCGINLTETKTTGQKMADAFYNKGENGKV